jgi:hypothetical protein
MDVKFDLRSISSSLVLEKAQRDVQNAASAIPALAHGRYIVRWYRTGTTAGNPAPGPLDQSLDEFYRVEDYAQQAREWLLRRRFREYAKVLSRFVDPDNPDKYLKPSKDEQAWSDDCQTLYKAAIRLRKRANRLIGKAIKPSGG